VDTFWCLLMDTFVHEKSSFWVNFRGNFLGEFYWTLFDGDNSAKTVGQLTQGVRGRSPC
jgi:hypothetical protein